MATPGDLFTGFRKETTFNTPVVVDRFLEKANGTGGKWDTGKKSTESIRTGSIGSRRDQNYYSGAKGSGSGEFPLLSKGFGAFLELCAGTSTSTLVSGTTFQQLHTLQRGLATRPSFTQQDVVVTTAGVQHASTFAGCSIDSFNIKLDSNGALSLGYTFSGYGFSTATAPATPVYAAGASEFQFNQGVVQYGGTLTPPTTTALGTMAGGATSTEVRSFDLGVNLNLSERPVVTPTNWNQPLVGMVDASLNGEFEYQNNTLRDLYLSGVTTLPVLITFTTTEALSTGFAQFQIALPDVDIVEHPQPPGTAWEVPTYGFQSKIMDNGTQMMYLAQRTADNAL